MHRGYPYAYPGTGIDKREVSRTPPHSDGGRDELATGKEEPPHCDQGVLSHAAAQG